MDGFHGVPACVRIIRNAGVVEERVNSPFLTLTQFRQKMDLGRFETTRFNYAVCICIYITLPFGIQHCPRSEISESQFEVNRGR